MRSKLRTICAALLVVFALGAVAASAASAAPEWYVKKAGTFAKVTEATKTEGTLSFEVIDTKMPLSSPMGVSCSATVGGEGEEIQPAGVSVIKHYLNLNCKPVKSCEKLLSVNPLTVPWKLELYKEGTEVRSRIVNGGSEAPGVTFACDWFGVRTEDTCQANTSTHMSNVLAGFVEASFDAKSAKTACTQGGTGSGEWKGAFATFKPVAKSGVEAVKVE